MRRNVFIFILATVALWGCIDRFGVDKNPARITWQAAENGASTKAYPTGFEAYPNYGSCTFGAYALLTDPVWSSSSTFTTYVDNEEVFYTPATASEEGYWTTHGTYYWPTSGHLHFAAYSPYRTLSSYVRFTQADKNNGLQIRNFSLPLNKDDQAGGITHTDPETGISRIVSYDYDLMVSDGTDSDYDCEATADNGFRPTLDGGGSTPITAYETGYKVGVHTLFKHIMTRLNFRFQMQTTDLNFQDQRIYVKSIRLLNLYSEGSYTAGNTYADGAWTYAATPVQNNGILVSYDSDQINNFEAPAIYCERDGNGNLVSVPVTLVDNYFALPQPLNVGNVAPYGQKLEITYVVFTINNGYYVWDKEVPAPPVDLYDSSLPAWERGKSITYTVTLAPAQNSISFEVEWDEWPGPSGWNTFTITD